MIVGLNRERGTLHLGKTIAFSITMVIAGVLAFMLVPKDAGRKIPPDLAKMLPSSFAKWHLVPGVKLVTAEDPGSLEKELYSKVVGQAYVDDDQHVVMLLMAYGPSQTDRLQLHRPEICYVANGFRVGGVTQTAISLEEGSRLPVKELTATREGRVEHITYWMRIGDKIANSVLRRQLLKIQFGLQGFIPDGLLVRTSLVGGASVEQAYAIQDEFIRDLTQTSPQLRKEMIGHI